MNFIQNKNTEKIGNDKMQSLYVNNTIVGHLKYFIRASSHICIDNK